MLLLRLAAIAAALLAVPAAAQDLTASYRPPGAKFETRFEIAANGDLRVSFGGQYYLSLGGVDYVVTAGPGGPYVRRIDDIVAARAGRPRRPYPTSKTVPSSRGEVTVNGRVGTGWAYPPVNGAPQEPYLVVSHDPALAPVGRAFRRYQAISRALSDFGADPNDPTDTLLGDGAPLHFFTGGDLVAVSNAPIPAARFALPAAPQPVEAFVRAEASEDGPDAGQRRMIKRAVFARGKLWLLADNGTLMTIDPATRALAEVAAPGPVQDLCRVEGAPLIVTGDTAGWTVRLLGEAGWQAGPAIAAKGETLAALSCSDSRLDLLTTRSLIEVTGDHQRRLRLSARVGQGLIVSTYAGGGALFVGLDAGEWGGGLIRIDRATGTVTPVDRRGPEICDGPLNGACDPVNGIAPEPGKPGCLLVAVGLVHMMPHGRLAEVCGDRIATWYYKPYTLDPDWHFDPKLPEDHQAVAFYGLATSGGVLWAAGLDGLYRIEAGGMTFTKLPAFDRIGGVTVSFALPGLVLVKTEINGRMALSGPVPLLVLR